MQAAQQQELEAMTDMFNKYALTLPPKPIRDAKAHSRRLLHALTLTRNECPRRVTRTSARAESQSWPCACAG